MSQATGQVVDTVLNLSARIAELRRERDHLQDLLKACQLAGLLPEALNRLVNCATAEESEGDIALRLSNARVILDQAYESIGEGMLVRQKSIWVTRNNMAWAASELGLTVNEVEVYYDKAHKQGIKCTLNMSVTMKEKNHGA